MDGFFGMYRGLTPKIVGSILGMLCSDKIADRLGLPPADENESDSKFEWSLDSQKDDSRVSDEEL